MFSAIGKRMRVSPTTVIATLALVFAMTGGAYAAKKYLITSTKQISPKVLKSLQGKAGPAGAAGAQGLAGAQGAAGAQGPGGAPGGKGENGVNGVSVTSKALKKGEGACTEGGSEFTSAGGKTSACNGKEGSPWTAGGTLPSGKTERGVWSVLYSATEAGQPMSAPISFDIPLETAPQANAPTNFIGPEEGEGEPNENKGAIPSHCKGTVASPEAVGGNLCVFVRTSVNATASAFGAVFFDPQSGGAEPLHGAGAGGAIVGFSAKAPGTVFEDGTWAVTAE